MSKTYKASVAGKRNLDILLEQLRYHEIKRLCMSFSGSNDSGDVYITDIKSIDDDVKLDADYLRSVNVTGACMSDMYEEGGKLRDWEKKPPTLHDLAYEVCWAELEANCGGWEIDSGSCGDFVFEPLAPLDKREPVLFSVSYNERDDYDYEDEEYNDE